MRVAGLPTFVAVVAAGISAWLWGKAAAVPIPPVTSDDSWEGKGPFADAMKRQATLNSRAAICAAIAAGAQALAMAAQSLGG
jgi:hypothetical protein